MLLSDKRVNILITSLLLLGIWARLHIYGDLRLSIGNLETQSYINSSKAPLLSWKLFAGQRLFTTNLIYKLANDNENCSLIAISNPADNIEVKRIIQPCFMDIALLQNLLAIFSWCYLAWTTSRWLNHPASKIGVALVILVFGFTPQIAEWDGILSPESLSLTLLIISFGLLQDIVFLIAINKVKFNSIHYVVLTSVWLTIFTSWIFVRDVNLYAIPITVCFLSILLLHENFRKTNIMLIVISILIGIFVLGFISAKDSLRATRYPLENAFGDYIFPFPARVKFFTRLGMPDPKSTTYQDWFDNNATKTYAYFLLLHPGFVVTTIWNDSYYFRAEFVQPYFKDKNIWNRQILLVIGEVLHPETNAVYIIDALLMTILCIKSVSKNKNSFFGWTWLAAWFLICSLITLMSGFFGDTQGVLRHIMPSVETLRLFMWIFLFILIDGYLYFEGLEIRGNKIE